MGTSSKTGLVMVRMSYSATSPAVSIPTKCPSSSAMGMEDRCRSVSITDQARLMVRASWRMGGVSKSKSCTWVRMLVRKRGGSKPKRFKMSFVSSLMWPSRAAVYSRSPTALRRAA